MCKKLYILFKVTTALIVVNYKVIVDVIIVTTKCRLNINLMIVTAKCSLNINFFKFLT